MCRARPRRDARRGTGSAQPVWTAAAASRPIVLRVRESRRVLLVLVAAAVFGVLAAGVKDQAGDGLSTASEVRGVIGNLSAPWLLLGLLAGAVCSSVRRGALVGLAATMTALTAFYALTGAVIDIDGQSFPRSALLWASTNRVYYAAGVISGLACGAAGAWWTRRRTRTSSPATSVLVVTGAQLLGEPLVLLVLGLVFPDGPVLLGQGPALLRQLVALPGSWTLTASRPPVTQGVYAVEAAVGVLVLLATGIADRRGRNTARA